MEFSVNSPILFLLAGIIVLIVLAQSAYFLIKAWRHGLAIGMEPKKLKKIAATAAVFTIAPAFPGEVDARGICAILSWTTSVKIAL